MDSYLLTPPAAEPVSIDTAKASARLDGAHWDAIVGALIPAARRVAEHHTGRRLMAQTWRHELVSWPAADAYLPELAPTAVAVSYWDGAAWVVLDGAAYVWAPAGPGRASIVLAPVLNTSWPDLGEVAVGPRVRVDVTSGAADAADVPAEALEFIKALVGLMAQDPTLTASDASGPGKYLFHLLDGLRLYR